MINNERKFVNFYKDQSVVVWNGNRVAGLGGIAQMFQQLPSTRHTIDSYDCQPVEGSTSCLLLVVNGSVQFGGSPKKPFHQSFVLMQDASSTYFVATDAMRFT
eukprot:Opistho-2@37440